MAQYTLVEKMNPSSSQDLPEPEQRMHRDSTIVFKTTFKGSTCSQCSLFSGILGELF